MVQDNDIKLQEQKNCLFHMTVAKLLFLSKRARPDNMTVISFLCTRVQCAAHEDQCKIDYILGYLQLTKQEKLVLCLSKLFMIEAYIDVAFALHSDSKSHSGKIIFVGVTMVSAASRKQKCITKNPT